MPRVIATLGLRHALLIVLFPFPLDPLQTKGREETSWWGVKRVFSRREDAVGFAISGVEAGKEMSKKVRKLIVVVAVLAAAWVGAGFIRAEMLEARWNRNLRESGADAFGGVKREGEVTIEVELIPLLLNPFKPHPFALLKVNGVPRAVLAG